MTTKQIAEAIGRPEKTVRTWAAKAAANSVASSAKMAEATPARPAEWDLDETLSIIETGLGKNAAALFRENALRPLQVPEDRLSRLEALVERLVVAVASFAPTKVTPLALTILPPPPELQPRDALRQIVEAWARGHGRDYHAAWSRLYEEYRLRYHRDLGRLAKARGVSNLDYADAENLVGQLLALAYFLYGQRETREA